MPDTSQAKFLTGSLMRHVTVMSLTSSVGLVAVFAVDFVDMIFISMLGHKELAAAVGYAGSILFVTMSISVGMSIATGALVARHLGSGEVDRARLVTTHVLIYAGVFACLFAAVFWSFLTPLTGLVGATGETRDLAVDYLRIIVPGMPFIMLGMAASTVLRAYGDARRAMWVTIIAGLVNAVLDPILIFGMGLELQGAAIASLISRLSLMVTAFWLLTRRYGGFVRPDMSVLKQDIQRITSIAFPAMLTNIATPIGAAYITRVMAQFGEGAVAGMAITARLTPISFAVVFALSGAIGPIVGQNFGAKDMGRVSRAIRDAVIFTLVYVLLASLVLFILRAPIADLFNADDQARALIYLFCGPLALTWFFNGVIFIGNASFNNLGRPLTSTAINWGRNTLGTIPFAAYGATLWGAEGVLIGQAIGGAVFAAISWGYTVRLLGYLKSHPETPERPSFAQRARQVQLFFQRR